MNRQSGNTFQSNNDLIGNDDIWYPWILRTTTTHKLSVNYIIVSFHKWVAHVLWKSFGWFIVIYQMHYVSIAPKTDWYVHRTTPTHKLKELHIPNIILRIWKTIYSLFDVSAWVFDARDCILVIIKMICKFISYLVMNFRKQYFC